MSKVRKIVTLGVVPLSGAAILLSTIPLTSTNSLAVATPATIVMTKAKKRSFPSCKMSVPSQWYQHMGRLANQTRSSWVASDGTVTTRLPNGDSLFMMGDTLWGKKAGDRFTGGSFVRNTAMVYHPNDKKGNCFTPYAGKISNGVLYTGSDKSDKAWYWPGKTIPMRSHDKTMFMFGNHMAQNGTGSFGFKQTGITLFKMKYQPGNRNLLVRQSAWNIPYLPGVTKDKEISWGWGTVASGSYVYVYGARFRQEPWVWGRDLYVARLPKRLAYSHPERTSSWQYWTKTGWARGANQFSRLSPLLENAVGAGGTVTLNSKRQFQITTRPNEFLDNRVVVYKSARPNGGFKVANIFGSPQPKGKWMYNAQAHPAIPAPRGKQWASVDVASSDTTHWARPSDVAAKWMLISR